MKNLAKRCQKTHDGDATCNTRLINVNVYRTNKQCFRIHRTHSKPKLDMANKLEKKKKRCKQKQSQQPVWIQVLRHSRVEGCGKTYLLVLPVMRSLRIWIQRLQQRTNVYYKHISKNCTKNS